MSGARAIFDLTLALIGLLAYVATASCAVRGWLSNRPDSSERFTLRVWTWVWFAVAIFTLDLSADRNWSWWHYVWLVSVFWMACSGIQKNWRKAEQYRKLERRAHAHDWTAQ